MVTAIKILPSNALASSPHYEHILTEYNLRLARDGRVNAGSFHAEVIAPLIPEYQVASWYKFLRRFKEAGNVQAGIAAAIDSTKPATPGAEIQEKVLLSNSTATAALVQKILNISALRAQEIIEHPEMLTHKEAIELGLKVMKAQDSRIHAVGKLREDNREQEKFDRAFDGAAFA